MGRRTKLNIKLENIDALQELMQEVYHDACGLIKDSQNTINTLMNSAEPMDTDDHTKLAKAKVDALKLKDSAIKHKMDIAKLQKEVIHKRADMNGKVEGNGPTASGGDVSISLDEFSRVRQMIENDAKNKGE